MPNLVPYVPDPKRYDEVFVLSMAGGSMDRYRGSATQNGSGFPQILKSLFAKIASFARPLLRSAAPHAKRAFAAAEPHLKEAASGLVKDLTDKASTAINNGLDSIQEGQGRKRRRRMKGAGRIKRLKRIPPFDLPDYI